MTVIESDLTWAYALTPRKATNKLIFHHAAYVEATVELIHKTHLANGWAGIAYHYYVRKDGKIYRGRPESVQGGHTLNHNHDSIGICFEGNFENEYMTNAQLEAGQWLTENIMRRYPGITLGQHKDYNATACAGKNFPFTYIINPNDEGEPEQVEVNKASAWAKEACAWAVEVGLFHGDENGDIPWQGTVTNEKLAVLFKRQYDLIKDVKNNV